MSKKIFLLLISIVVGFVSVSAQTMKDVFLAMPDSVMPLLSKDNRADFIDFLASKMQARVRNAYNEYSYMDTLTTDYTRIRLAPSGEVTMKLLPLTDSTKIVCLVHTYHADASESTISFYNTKWKLLNDKSFLTIPQTEDFLDGGSGDSLAILKPLLNVSMVVASLSPSTTDLTFTYDVNYLPQEDKKLVKGRIRTAIVKKWENGKYISK